MNPPGRLRRYFLVFLVGAIAGAAAFRWANHVRTEPSASEMLDRPVREVQIVDEPLEDAARKLGDAAGVPIVVDRISLSDLGIDAARRVTVRGQQVPLCILLDELVQPYRNSLNRAVWIVQPHQVLITSDMRQRTPAVVFRAYDVRDLLASAGPKQQVKLRSLSIPTGNATGSFAPPVSRLPGGSSGGSPPGVVAAGLSAAEQRLLHLLRRFVSESNTSWLDQSPGWVGYYGDHLLVCQPARSQLAVAEFLGQLRTTLQPMSAPATAPAGPRAGMAVWSDRLSRWVAADPSGTEAKLDLPLPPIRLENVPLAEALRRVGRAAGIDVLMLPAADAGPPADVYLTADLRGLTLADGLSAVLRSSGQERLHWWLAGEVVHVRVEDERQSAQVTRVYDMRDWLDPRHAADWPRGLAESGRTNDDASPANIREVYAILGFPEEFPPSDVRRISLVGGHVIVKTTWEDQVTVRRALGALNMHHPASTRPTAGNGGTP